ncbi:b-glycanase [Caudoviricetes sp.]|nr:b-glycanase [Caudoviricetes sp.]
MGSLSDYSENKLLDLALGAVAFTRPATVYGSLHTATLNDDGTGTEVSGTSYVRKSITNNATNFPAASALSKALAVQQDFATAGSGGWGTVTDAGLWDASSSGNLLLADVIAISRTIGVGDTPRFDASTGLVISLSGAISTFLGNALLDHLLGGGDYTPPATWYLALLVSGVEVSGNGYVRKAVANNTTNFPNASGGTKSLAVQTDFAPPSGLWGLVDEVRLYDAASAGNLGFSKTLTTPRTIGVGNPGRFSAGALTFSLT